MRSLVLLSLLGLVLAIEPHYDVDPIAVDKLPASSTKNAPVASTHGHNSTGTLTPKVPSLVSPVYDMDTRVPYSPRESYQR